MTAEEYVKHYASGQGGYESVPVDIALRTIEHAKREGKQQMMKDAVEVQVGRAGFLSPFYIEDYDKVKQYKYGDKLKMILSKEK